MPHRRQSIREAVVTTVTGLATTGGNVTSGRVYPEQTSALPALNVVTLNEIRQESDAVMGWQTGGGPDATFRNLEVVIEARAAGDAVDSTLDQIALEVETAMSTDVTFGALCQWSFLSATEIEFSGEFEEPVSIARLTYTVQYRVDPSDPQ